MDDGSVLTAYKAGSGLFIPRELPKPPEPEPEPPVDPGPGPAPGTGAWTHPLPGATLTSPYGPRAWDGVGNFHWGADLSTGVGSVGQPVLAPTDLKITIAMQAGDPGDESYGTAGTYCKGHTLDGRWSFSFFHMVRDSLRVRAGQEVGVGTVLGIEGVTGNVTGLHLHLECYEGIRPNDWPPPYGNPIDPLPVLRANGVAI